MPSSLIDAMSDAVKYGIGIWNGSRVVHPREFFDIPEERRCANCGAWHGTHFDDCEEAPGGNHG